MLKENIIKGWVTSIMGIIIYVIATFFIWQRVINFIWEGIAAYVLGTLLLMFPRTIEKGVMAGIKGWANRGNSYYPPSYDPNTNVPPMQE